MIELTRINNEAFYLNCDLIEHVDEVPHTVVKMSNNNTYVVKESAFEIVQKIIEYKRKIFDGTLIQIPKKTDD